MSKAGTHFNTLVGTNKKSVGFYTIGETLHYHVASRPTEEQIKNLKELLGWVWTDE